MGIYRLKRLAEVGREMLEHFHLAGRALVSRGHLHIAESLPALVALLDADPVGLLVYSLSEQDCEIVLLDTTIQRVGIGPSLLRELRKVARRHGCARVCHVTTNDNTDALRFYQRNGFRIVAVYPDAVERSRALLPELPRVGMDDILIRDEIELEFRLQRTA